MAFLTLNNFMILPLYQNVVTISKDLNLIFSIFFKITLYISVIATIKFAIFQRRKSLPGTWLSLEKWYSRERAMLPLSICEIKFWGNSNCEFLQLKTFTVLAWFTTFELAVVLMNISENLDSIWNSSANSPLFRQCKHQKRF